jgi:hypothetical protein
MSDAHTNTLPLGFIDPILVALDEQAPDVRDRLWAAIDRGNLTYRALPDGRIEFRAGGEAFLRMECVGVFPVAADAGQTH